MRYQEKQEETSNYYRVDLVLQFFALKFQLKKASKLDKTIKKLIKIKYNIKTNTR